LKNNLSVIKWIYYKTRKKLPLISILTALSALISVIGVQFALASKTLIDSALVSHDKFIQNGIYIATLLCMQLIMQIAYSLLYVRTEGKLKIDLKTRVFNMLLKKDYCDVTKHHTGELLNRIESDVQIITSGVVNIIPTTIALLTQLILSVIALLSLDRSLTLIFLMMAPVMIIVSRFYSRYMKPLHKDFQKTNGIAHSFILESLQNLLVLKSFVNEKAVTSFAEKLQYDNLKISLKRNRISLIGNIGFFLLLNVGFYFSMIWCVFKISLGLMSYGTLTAILQLVNNVQSPFRSLSGVIPQIFNVIASAERLIELENMKDDSIEQADHISIYNNLKSIDIKNITFRYDEEDILSDASVSINKGEFIAIAGMSGIGKSTFFKLIMAILKPVSGKISLTLNDSEIEINSSVRKLFAYVPQSNMLLSGTIYDNIRFYKEDITENQIAEAADMACVSDFVKELPDGLNTKIGEKGLGLSEGQIQRIAIARALVQNSPILLLDEATSALDEDTEKKVLHNIKKCNNKTCIVISHRPAVFDICDKIIRIADKKITDA